MSPIEGNYFVRGSRVEMLDRAFVGHTLNLDVYIIETFRFKIIKFVCQGGEQVPIIPVPLVPKDKNNEKLIAHAVPTLDHVIFTRADEAIPLLDIIDAACEKAGCGEGGENCKVLEAKQAKAKKRNQKVWRR